METKISNLVKAVIAVMKDVKGIDKTMTVGSGTNSYKGVPDQEVKKIIGDAMAKHGLAIIPIDIQAKTEVSRWEEVDTYSKLQPPPMKQKQSVFTEVHTKYLLMHESGESQVISGYGHGVDSQDKGAGKATTYALKYALLYSFLVPTGKIDDSDAEHSDNHETPIKDKEWLNENTENWYKVVDALSAPNSKFTIEHVEQKYKLNKTIREKLKNLKQAA